VSVPRNGNYQAANVTLGGSLNNNGSTSAIAPSMNFGAYSGNVLFVNSYNTNKPNIQLTYAPNVYLLNSVNTLQYNTVSIPMIMKIIISKQCKYKIWIMKIPYQQVIQLISY